MYSACTHSQWRAVKIRCNSDFHGIWADHQTTCHDSLNVIKLAATSVQLLTTVNFVLQAPLSTFASQGPFFFVYVTILNVCDKVCDWFIIFWLCACGMFAA
eukprot:scpid111563/ scgid9921/ 